MGALEELKVLIVGSATGAVTAMREAGTEAEVLEAKTAGASAEMKTLGATGSASGSLLKAGIVGGVAVAGAALAKFALDGVGQFSDLTAQTRSLRNVMGGTAEDASRIAGAARGLGLDVDTVSKGFFQLTKRIADNKDTLAQNGIEVERNNDGSVNMAKTLVNVSEGYKAITDPAEKNLFLMQNFGKAGSQLIPLLAQGKDKLAEFYAQTAKHGEVFSEDDLEKGRQYKVAMNELNQAWEGLSSTLGRELIPYVTQFLVGLERIVSAIPNVVSGISDFVSNIPVLGSLDPHGNFERGLDVILGKTDEVDKRVGFTVDGINEKFAGLDSAHAAQVFLDLSVEAAKSGVGVGGANQRLLDFVQIAKQDVGVASQVIEGLKARGENTEVYERALKHIASQQLDNIAATEQQKEANTLLTGSYEDQIKVIDKAADALLAEYDKGFAAIHATEALADSVKELTDKRQAAADAGGQDAAANDAATRAMVATEEQAIHTAVALGQKAEADHQGEGAAAAHQAGIDAQKGSLEQLASTLAPDDPLRIFLQGYIDKLNDPAINSVHAAGVSLDLSGLEPLRDMLTTLQAIQQIGDVNVRVKVLQDEIVGGIVSDRDRKRDFADIDPAAILAAIERLDVTTWRYDFEAANVRHIGPMAQDFAEMFSLGDDPRLIAHVDANGVLLAAVKALAGRVAELERAA